MVLEVQKHGNSSPLASGVRSSQQNTAGTYRRTERTKSPRHFVTSCCRYPPNCHGFYIDLFIMIYFPTPLSPHNAIPPKDSVIAISIKLEKSIGEKNRDLEIYHVFGYWQGQMLSKLLQHLSIAQMEFVFIHRRRRCDM